MININDTRGICIFKPKGELSKVSKDIVAFVGTDDNSVSDFLRKIESKYYSKIDDAREIKLVYEDSVNKPLNKRFFCAFGLYYFSADGEEREFIGTLVVVRAVSGAIMRAFEAEGVELSNVSREDRNPLNDLEDAMSEVKDHEE